MRYLFLVFLLICTACESPEIPLPGVTGRAGELVVVMSESKWKGAAGDTVFNTFSQDVYGLPQPEPIFNVVHIKSSSFTKIFRTHRNIVLVNIGEKYPKRIELKTNVWATPQAVVEISAPTEEVFFELFEKNAAQIIEHISKKEQDRIQRSYNAQINADVVTPLKTKLGLKLGIPSGYNLVRDEPDFSWIRYETRDVTQSILVYSEPYTRDDTFTKEGMVEVMNKFSKKYVGGPDNGTYLSTYVEYPPRFTETSISNKYASKLTGLWHIEGALMGGPFVSYAFLDASEKRVFYLQAFVFAPSKKKRNYIRQVDAILRGAELVQ